MDILLKAIQETIRMKMQEITFGTLLLLIIGV
jgi:hypothetical protein